MFLCLVNLCQAKITNIRLHNYEGTSGVPVGNRTGDSTGNLTISNSGIQQSILSSVPMFTGWAMTNENTMLSVSSNHSYLIFKLVKPSGDTAKVAVELALENNLFVFNPHAGSKILFYTTYGNPTNCQFLKDRTKSIVGCRCDENSANINASSGSNYAMIITQ
jgi:hypothetical protein